MLKPLNNHVVLEVVEVELTPASGIILSREAAKPSHSEGVILVVREGRILDNGQRLPLDVMVGQRVIYNGFGGTKVNHQGKDLVIVSSEDILAIVE